MVFATEKVNVLKPAIQAFIVEHLHPLESAGLDVPFSQIEPQLRELRQRVKAAGWWGLQWSEHEGGHGLSLCEFGQISEVLAWSPFGHYVFNVQAPDIGNMELLHRFGTEAQKAMFLMPLMAGDIRSCFAMTEPQLAGSNPVNLHTIAVLEGDEYVLNGHKWFTTGADGAAFAVVMAVTNPEAAPHLRAAQIIVPTDTRGWTLVRNIPVMGHAGDGWNSHAEVILDNVRVPAANLIGQPGSGFKLAQERLGPGRIHHCMRWIGAAERCFDLMCRHAASRDMGEGRLLSEKQFIQGFIAESRVEIDAARLLVLHTAYMIDRQGAAAVRNEISGIKFYVANMLQRVIDRAIQTHGALGITDDTILAYYYRHERAARIYDGADEVHKSALAKQVLKNYT